VRKNPGRYDNLDYDNDNDNDNDNGAKRLLKPRRGAIYQPRATPWDSVVYSA
jgi:hypothetical protein